jgi:hypothetical protein
MGAEIAGGYASPYGHQHAANNKYLARSNKSRMRAEATKLCEAYAAMPAARCGDETMHDLMIEVSPSGDAAA